MIRDEAPATPGNTRKIVKCRQRTDDPREVSDEDREETREEPSSERRPPVSANTPSNPRSPEPSESTFPAGGETAQPIQDAPMRIIDLLDLEREIPDDTFGYSLLHDTLSDVAHRTDSMSTVAANPTDLPTAIYGPEGYEKGSALWC